MTHPPSPSIASRVAAVFLPQPCPDNTVTADMIPGFDSPPDAVLGGPDACYAIPGHAWSSNGLVEACDVGSYREGFTTNPAQDCVPCGEGLTTAGNGTAMRTDCHTLPGYFVGQNPDDAFAMPALAGFYAAGNDDSLHQCAEGSSTLFAQASSADACVVATPGWGFDAATGLIARCTSGTFSPGGAEQACMPW